jgi:GNAT superfamily N-acetyltransferase
MDSIEGVIRPFEEKDRESVRAICRRTGQKGRPTSLFFEDEEIIPMLYADYYTDYEPDSCFVAESDGKVVGYILGCPGTRRYNKIMFTRVYPRVCLRIFWKILTLQYRKKQTYATLWWIISRGWSEGFSIPVDRYPGHIHFNLESEYRGRGLGERLSIAAGRRMREKGIIGSHCIIREEEGDNSRSGFLCRERGYEIMKIKRNTVWEKVTGNRWYAKLLVRDLRSDYNGEP